MAIKDSNQMRQRCYTSSYHHSRIPMVGFQLKPSDVVHLSEV